MSAINMNPLYVQSAPTDTAPVVPLDTQTKVSTEAAQIFVESYYKALNLERGTIASFYMKPNAVSATKPDISLNGELYTDPAKLQEYFVTKVPTSQYDVQAYDCHPLNTNFSHNVANDQLAPDASGSKMSLVLLVSGYVKYGELKDAPMLGFSETFTLVPNPDLLGVRSKAGKGRKWLIQTQNFRMLYDPTIPETDDMIGEEAPEEEPPLLVSTTGSNAAFFKYSVVTGAYKVNRRIH